MTNYMMVNITHPRGTPELEALATEFGVPLDAFDATFGVIAVTPEEGIYAVRVLKEWAEKIVAVPGTDGPFPEGSVEPFGPPR